jgi:hypothetical protein
MPRQHLSHLYSTVIMLALRVKRIRAELTSWLAMSTTLKVSNGDLFIDSVLGQPQLIAGVEKCSQDIACVLMTEYIQSTRHADSMPRAFGSELATLNTPVQYSGLIGRPMVQRKIQEAIQRLEDLQNKDPYITDDEKIKGITKLNVQQLSDGDFVYWLECEVQSGNTTPSVTNLTPVSLDHQFPLTSGIATSVRNAR